MNKQQINIFKCYKIILLKIKIPYDRFFSCSKVFWSKVKFTIVYYSKFPLGLGHVQKIALGTLYVKYNGTEAPPLWNIL